jgi:hypothetical protein
MIVAALSVIALVLLGLALLVVLIDALPLSDGIRRGLQVWVVAAGGLLLVSLLAGMVP